MYLPVTIILQLGRLLGDIFLSKTDLIKIDLK